MHARFREEPRRPGFPYNARVIYRFDGTDERLQPAPVAARRAFDRAGLRLSDEVWTALPVPVREKVVELGAARDVDGDGVREAVRAVVAGVATVPRGTEPPADRVPAVVAEKLTPALALSDGVWASLHPLDRFALAEAGRGSLARVEAAHAEIVGARAISTHLGAAGGARMVDVGEKVATRRRAVGESVVTMTRAAFDKLRSADVAKGDVLGAARLAGIMASKRTPELIPLCHSVALSNASVEFTLDATAASIRVVATVEAVDRTGVEMEALVAASVAALTIYDMLKSSDRAMTIGPTRLVEKTGGRSGDFRR